MWKEGKKRETGRRNRFTSSFAHKSERKLICLGASSKLKHFFLSLSPLEFRIKWKSNQRTPIFTPTPFFLPPAPPAAALVFHKYFFPLQGGEKKKIKAVVSLRKRRKINFSPPHSLAANSPSCPLSFGEGNFLLFYP